VARLCQECAVDRFDMWWRPKTRKALTTISTSGGGLVPGSILIPGSTTTPVAGPVLSTGHATVERLRNDTLVNTFIYNSNSEKDTDCPYIVFMFLMVIGCITDCRYWCIFLVEE